MSNDAPPAVAKPKKRALKVLAVLAGCLALFVASFPWWSPWLARAAVGSLDGAKIDRLQALSWDRWQLRGVSYEADGVSISADEAELPSPAGFLLKRSGPNRVELNGWRVETRPTPDSPRAPADARLGPGELFDMIERYWRQAASHKLSVDARSGLVVVDGSEILKIDRAELDADSLRVQAIASGIGALLEISLDRGETEGQWRTQLAAPGFESEATLEIARSEGRVDARGFVDIKGNRVDARAAWTEAGAWMPAQAELSADGFALEKTVPSWPQDLPLRATATATWEDGSYRFKIAGRDPREDADSPGEIQLSGRGDLESLHLDAGRVRLPWISATLDEPVDIAYSLDNPLGDAAARLVVDLAELPWIEGRGSLRVDLRAVARADGQPEARLEISSSDAALRGIQLEQLSGSLELVGRALTVKGLEAKTAAGSRLSASGQADLEARSLTDVRASGALADEFQRFRGEFPLRSWSNLDFDLTAAGPWQNPRFEVNARIAQAQFPDLQPLGLGLEFAGELRDFEADLELSSPQAVASLNVRASLRPEASSFEIRELSARYADGNAYELQAPATLQFDAAARRLALAGFDLRNAAGGGLAVSRLVFSATAFVAEARVDDLPAQAVSAWLANPLPELRVRQAALALDFGPDSRNVQTSGQVDGAVGAGTPIELSWSAAQRDDEPLLAIESLAVSSQGRSILQASGALPLSLSWANQSFEYELDENAPFEIALDSSPHPDFWTAAERFLPAAITRPTIKVELSGTLAEPSGRAGLKLESVRWQDPARPGFEATLSDIDIVIRASPSLLEATSVAARLGGNRIQASGSLPLERASLPEMVRSRAPPNLRELVGQATLELTDFAALEAWMPEFVRSEGSVHVDVAFKPGSVEGVALLDGLSTMPLPPLGTFSKIQGALRFANGKFQVENVTGLAEQSPFTLSGSADFSDPRAPRYDLAFRSDAFPLARDTGLLLSGDLDIRLRTSDEDPPVISGKILLSKGLLLAEPDLLSASAKTSAKRPPYFSVEQDPFREWGLDLAIEGEDFMRVSNSYFQGTLSADFHLEGTLQTPLLVGKATATEGRIYFPATSLSLASGELSITRDRPSQIQIEATANGRIYGYDAHLIAAGDISDPEITVTTNPALTQVEALLLVTTGALPSSEGGLAEGSAASLGLFVGKGLFRRIMPGSNASAERLDIEVGRDISLQGKSTIEARYRLSDTLSLEGEYDERDEYNANFKWTFYEK